MKKHLPAILVASILVVVGACCMAGRIKGWQNGMPRAGGSVWRLTYTVVLRPAKTGDRVRIVLPDRSQNARIMREEFSYSGLLMDVLQRKHTKGREAEGVVIKGAEDAVLSAQFDIQVRPEPEWKGNTTGEHLNSALKSLYLKKGKNIQIDNPNVLKVAAELAKAKKSKMDLLEGIFDYCHENIVDGDYQAAVDAAGALEHQVAAPLGRARAMIALCRANHIPARLVSGFILSEQPQAQPHVWIEALAGKRWTPYDPLLGYSREMPLTHLAVSSGVAEIVKTSHVSAPHVEYSIERLQSNSSLNNGRRIIRDIPDLTRLAPAMQGTLAIILLVPVGALVTAFCRNIIGIHTFGTFTPSLLALSFVRTELWTGMIMLGFVLTVAVLIRILLDRLKLLAVSRLSAILVTVTLCVALSISTLDFYGLTPTAHVVLLPMVIITMVIERFHISAEEDGILFAFLVLAGTIAVAIACTGVFRLRGLERTVLCFPETLLFVAATLILMGRYTGYRLVELWRFRDMGKIK